MDAEKLVVAYTHVVLHHNEPPLGGMFTRLSAYKFHILSCAVSFQKSCGESYLQSCRINQEAK